MASSANNAEELPARRNNIEESNQVAAAEDELVEYPEKNDVICGRGGHATLAPANVRYRTLVDTYKDRYNRAGKREKARVAHDIVRIWRRQEPRGRFLARTEPERGDGSPYRDVGDRRAITKTQQCLRERLGPTIDAQAIALLTGLPSSGVSRTVRANIFHRSRQIPVQQQQPSLHSVPGAAVRQFHQEPVAITPPPSLAISVPTAAISYWTMTNGNTGDVRSRSPASTSSLTSQSSTPSSSGTSSPSDGSAGSNVNNQCMSSLLQHVQQCSGALLANGSQTPPTQVQVTPPVVTPTGAPIDGNHINAILAMVRAAAASQDQFTATSTAPAPQAAPISQNSNSSTPLSSQGLQSVIEQLLTQQQQRLQPQPLQQQQLPSFQVPLQQPQGQGQSYMTQQESPKEPPVLGDLRTLLILALSLTVLGGSSGSNNTPVANVAGNRNCNEAA